MSLSSPWPDSAWDLSALPFPESPRLCFPSHKGNKFMRKKSLKTKTHWPPVPFYSSPIWRSRCAVTKWLCRCFEFGSRTVKLHSPRSRRVGLNVHCRDSLIVTTALLNSCLLKNLEFLFHKECFWAFLSKIPAYMTAFLQRMQSAFTQEILVWLRCQGCLKSNRILLWVRHTLNAAHASPSVLHRPGWFAQNQTKTTRPELLMLADIYVLFQWALILWMDGLVCQEQSQVVILRIQTNLVHLLLHLYF